MKRLGILFIGLLLAAVFVPLASAQTKGDTNCDGQVTTLDMVVQLHYVGFGLAPLYEYDINTCGPYEGMEALRVAFENSDVDGDGDVDVRDAILTGMIIAGA